jgi:uncharacterized repeat protein (TIGR01451 family)
MSTDPTVTGNTDSTWTYVTTSSSSTTPTAPELAVAVDQADTDYAPGETVGITASNVEVGATVTFDVEHVLADGTVASDLTGTGTPWTVADGSAGDLDGAANGVIETSWYVNDDAANQAFTLSATDTATGETATAAFTDKPSPPPASVPDVGVLAAPTGAPPTGETDPDGSSSYNNTHWAVLDGATITGTILNATDAVTASGDAPGDGDIVWVEIKSTEHGNTYVPGTYHSDNSITFTWTVEAPDGSDICNTTIVAYETQGGFDGSDQSGLFTNTSNDLANDGVLDGDGNASGGFGIVNLDGSHHVCDDDGGQAALALSKDTVCPEDESHSVNGGTLLVGNKVEWIYTLTGVEGSVSDITLTDNQNGTDFVIYDANGVQGGATIDYTIGDTDNLLEAGEVWTFKLTGDVVVGDYTNTATASGTNAATGEAGVSGESLQNSYFGANPGITIDKYIVCDDHTTPLADTATLLSGTAFNYVLTVKNEGNIILSPTVSDPTLGDLGTAVETGGTGTIGDGVFDPGETWTYTVAGTWAEGSNTNTATVTASYDDSCGDSWSAEQTDSATYFGAKPGISIEKDIICSDGHVLPANTAVNLLEDGGGQVEYRIVVTNEGNVDLSNVNVADLTLSLGSPTESIDTDGVLQQGETWTYTVLADWTAGGPHTNTATVTASYDDSCGGTWSAGDGKGESDSASYFGLDPSITLNKLTNGSDGPDLLQGQAITWTYDVTNDGNVDLTGVSVSDSPGQTITAINGTGIYSGFNSGDTNHDGVFTQGETWHFQATGTAGTGLYTNTATATTAAVTDDCGESVTPTATDGSSYTGHARAVEGLTKGYWATHLTLWDVYNGDEKGSGSEINVAGKYDWNKDLSTTNVVQSDLTSTGPSSSLGLVKTTSKDSGLLMGDLNHDGLVNDGCDLFFDLTSAQLLANNSVSGDARIILASQAVAAQLNEYQGYVNYGHDTSPNGLLSEAAQWLKGLGPLSNGNSNVDTNTANDLGLPAKTVISDSAGSDYTVKNGVITLGGTALSSSDGSWQTKAQVFSEADANLDINGDGQKNDTVWANGEGLKNALAAYNHGLSGTTAGFVVAQDGSQIGWENSIGGTVTDVHANAPDVFWGILANHTVTGVEWHLA